MGLIENAFRRLNKKDIIKGEAIDQKVDIKGKTENVKTLQDESDYSGKLKDLSKVGAITRGRF